MVCTATTAVQSLQSLVIDSGIECPLSKPAEDTKLTGALSMLEGQDVIQRHQDKLENGTQINLNQAKCKILYLGWDNPYYQYKLGEDVIQRSLAEKDLG